MCNHKIKLNKCLLVRMLYHTISHINQTTRDKIMSYGNIKKSAIETATVLSELPNNHYAVWLRGIGTIEFIYSNDALYSNEQRLLEAGKWDHIKNEIKNAKFE